MNSDTISPNLTFEEFKEYADRQPSLDGNWIYRMEHIVLNDNTMYPEFKTFTSEYYFHTFEDAENFIREIISDETDAYADTYAFIITQLAVGEKHWSPRGASWLYDYKGNLIDYCITTCEEDPYKSAFFGRSAERMRFKKGDIVEVLSRDSVNLAVVAADGPSVEWFWGLYNRSKDKCGGYFADASDDCYYIIDGPGYAFHSHAPALSLMKPRFPIPEDVRDFFRHCLDKAEEECCIDRYTVASYSEDISELSATSIGIRYDADRRHHVLVKEIYDDTTCEWSIHDLDADEIARLTPWLNQVLYGKSRLWYIIREWNNQDRDEDREPELSPDTTVSQLLHP